VISRSLVFVHAHPDDEVLFTGGTIARYLDEGARVTLITCTNGEVGEIADVPELGTIDEIRPRLGEVRIDELRAACAELGAVDLRLLGYHDSGMDGTPENEAPEAFVNQDIEEVIGKVAAIIDEVGAQIVVTYNAIGSYGHPDHIKAHDAAMGASKRCDIAKTYHIATPKSFIRAARDMAEEFGFSRDDFFSEEEIERIGTDDDEITTTLDVVPYIDRKFRALAAHRTQLGTTARVFAIPEELRPLAFGNEFYVLARSTVGPRGASAGVESDLFEGLDA